MHRQLLLICCFFLATAGFLPAQNCVIEIELLDLVCDAAGTPNNPTDDSFEFVVAVAADNGSPEGYVYFTNDQLLSGTGAYGQNLALGPLPVGEAPISLSVVDAADPACNASIVIELPADCGSNTETCGTGALLIALAQDTVCRGGEQLSVTVLAEPTGQPAGYGIRYFLYAALPSPNMAPLASWTGTPPNLYPLTEPNRTYYLVAGSVLSETEAGDCALYADPAAFFVSGPDLTHLPEELSLCGQQTIVLSAVDSNVIGPVTEIVWRRNGEFFSDDAIVEITQPGEYWVLVRDANGCAEDRTIIVFGDGEFPAFTVETFGCGQNGEACLVPAPGEDYEVIWSNGMSGAACVGGLPVGTHEVTIFGLASECSVTLSFAVESSGTLDVTEVAIQEVGCTTPGRIAVTIAGGQPPYTYSWSEGSTTPVLEDIQEPGDYLLTVTDSAGCTLTQIFFVPGSAPLQLGIEASLSAGCDDASGAIYLFPFGGQPPYSYAWSTGGTDSVLLALAAGGYAYTVTDAAGCSVADSTTIEPGFEVWVSGTRRLACNTGQTTLTAQPEGDYTYTWSGPGNFAADTRSVTVSQAGTYLVTVTAQADPNCVAETAVVVLEAEVPPTGIEVVYSAQCGVPPRLWPLEPQTNLLSYLWETPSGELIENQVTIEAPVPGWYYLESRLFGQNCTLRDSVFISAIGTDCAQLTGRLFADEGNCQLDGTETLVPGWRVEIDALTGSFSTIVLTDAGGNWSASVPPGNYQVFALPYNNLYLNCSPPAQVNLPDASSTASVDVLMPWIEACPAMWTDLSIPFLRRCFPSQIFVSYCNDGSVVAEAARLVVRLDPFMEYLESDLPPALITADSLVFEVGDLAPFACGSFAIQVRISCDAVLGQTHCASVHAYPDAPCPDPENWSGANVALSAACAGDSLQFSIENVGDGPMTVPLQYIVIEDGIMMMATPAQAEPLQPGATLLVDLPATGTTYHLFTNQEPNAPGAGTPTLAVEGCGATGSGTFSTGFVNQFPLSDGDTPWLDEDCAQNVGAYDPNDKQGFPVGYGAERYIEAGTRLEYNIRFQNTGTDTAFTVVLRDTLAPELDLATLRLVSASHAYRARLDTQRVLTVTFDDILLPDSATNLLGSQGVLQLSIVAREDLAPGTIVTNRAGIYFDFNAPILTNTTRHTIGSDFVQVVALEAIPNLLARLEIYPNPSDGRATVRITGGLPDRYTLVVTDVLGRTQLRTEWTGPTQDLHLGHLPPGWYVVRLEDHGGKPHRIGRVLLR